MKINNWCRKLAAALVAGGVLAPSAAYAAGLNTNVVANPGFELVDTNVGGLYSAVNVLNWNDGTRTAFAYNYGQHYDFGGPLAGGGTYYFTPNQSGGDGTDVTAPGTIAQLIDVSSGPSAAVIASGSATFNLSAFFTSYANSGRPGGTDADIGNIELRFLDASNSGISAVTLSDPNPLAGWKQASMTGAIPVGTAQLLVSLYGTPVTFGPDGYLDNLDLRIAPEPNAALLGALGAAITGLFGPFGRRRNS